MFRKYFILLLSTLYIVVGVFAVFGGATDVASVKKGSSGDDVKKIQQRLSSWGYYKGDIDGVFGSATETAVKAFQKNNGLTADGVVGSATAAKIGISLSGSSGSSGNSGSSGGTNNSGDVYLLARLIYGEARGEPYKGQVAVGAVVLNRVEDPAFPNTIAGVIYQPKAFSVVADGQINLSPDENSLRAARDAMNGWDPTGGCVYYYNPSKTSNSYMHSLTTVLVIGEHHFAK